MTRAKSCYFVWDIGQNFACMAWKPPLYALFVLIPPQLRSMFTACCCFAIEGRHAVEMIYRVISIVNLPEPAD